MLNRSIDVKVIKANSGTITIKLVSANRKMPVKREAFFKNVDNGTYNVLNPQVLEDIQN